MGNTTYKGSSASEIHVDGGDGPRVFAPGDTITGRVSRSEPTVSANGVVKITLAGRTKTKIGNYHGSNNNVIYRGRFTVIDDEALTRKIFEGPVHVASNTGPASWPFSIKIPKYCSPRMLAGSAPRGESFLPLDSASISKQPLPDSFGLSHKGQDADSEGFIEYFLTATISYKGSRQNHETVLPITIRSSNTAPSLEDFSLSQHRVFEKLSSWHLVPGNESAELSFSQKRQKLFGSSKVPRLAGTMEIDVPGVLQLGSPSLVPIRLRFVPDAANTSNDLRDIPLRIELTSLIMQIVSRTDMKCHAAVFSPRETAAEKIWSHDIWPPSKAAASSEPLNIPYSDEEAPVDVGTLADFRLPSYLSDVDTAPRDRLLAGFTTYNIRHSHRTRFRLVAMVSGQQIKMKLEQELKLLPPVSATASSMLTEKTGRPSATVEEAPPPSFEEVSGAWIQPPAEDDAPPAFAPAQMEGVAQKS